MREDHTRLRAEVDDQEQEDPPALNPLSGICSQTLTPGIPTITDCVLAELEKLGPKYRLALKIAKDPRFDRLHCDRKLLRRRCPRHWTLRHSVACSGQRSSEVPH